MVEFAASTIPGVADMLTLSAHLPEVELAAGEIVMHEGAAGGAIWVLVSGALQVRKGDVVVNAITHPGALIGEISVLLGGDYTATVETTAPTTLRLTRLRRQCSSSRLVIPPASGVPVPGACAGSSTSMSIET